MEIRDTGILTVEDVARICHEANRAYCLALGDDSQAPWEDAPGWQQSSAMQGVQFHLDNPAAGEQASHDNWMQEKQADGWTYGPEKDAEKKEHPCMVPYLDLPIEQRLKDRQFCALVGTFAPYIRR